MKSLQDRLQREAREKLKPSVTNNEWAKQNKAIVSQVQKLFDALWIEQQKDLDQIISHTISETIKAGVSVIEGEMENFADTEHERWSKWQSYLHGKLEFNGTDWVLKNEWYERWNRQIHTPYCNLSEKEKESDREQVRPYIQTAVTKLQELNK